MGTTADKFQYLADTKALIKAAIVGKGQSIVSGDTFRSYATKIGNISAECTAAASNILSGKTAYSGGSKITGTIASKTAETFAPSTSARTITAGQYLSGTQTISAVAGTAGVGDVLSGKTFASASGVGLAGTMANRGAVTSTISTQGGQYTVPTGYHNGSGKVTASFANLVAGNVKSGVNVGGVVGSLAGVPQRTITLNNGYEAYSIERYCMFGGNSKIFDFTGALSNLPTSVNIYGDILVTHTVTVDTSGSAYYYFYLWNGIGGTQLEKTIALSGNAFYVTQIFALSSATVTMGITRN